MSALLRTIASVVTAGALAGILTAPPAMAELTWTWSYSGNDIIASGTFTTADIADADGFYQITGISGSRNGDAITALYPTGSAIPGNDGYPVDNLVRMGPQVQLTVHGFGFTTASGSHANPYFADFLSPPQYMEVFTTPSSTLTELPIAFSAALVPEPGTAALVLCGLGLLVAAGYGRRPSRE